MQNARENLFEKRLQKFIEHSMIMNRMFVLCSNEAKCCQAGKVYNASFGNAQRMGEKNEGEERGTKEDAAAGGSVQTVECRRH